MGLSIGITENYVGLVKPLPWYVEKYASGFIVLCTFELIVAWFYLV